MNCYTIEFLIIKIVTTFLVLGSLLVVCFDLLNLPNTALVIIGYVGILLTFLTGSCIIRNIIVPHFKKVVEQYTKKGETNE